MAIRDSVDVNQIPLFAWAIVDYVDINSRASSLDGFIQQLRTEKKSTRFWRAV